MKKLTIYIFVLFLFSCENQVNTSPDPLDQETVAKEGILVFNSTDKLFSTLSELTGITEDLLYEKEKSQGFESYYSVCERVYDKVINEGFNSIEELEEIVNKNSKYLQICVDDNGEFTLETACYLNRFRKIINEDGLFQINDRVYKVFNDCWIETGIENINSLKLIT